MKKEKKEKLRMLLKEKILELQKLSYEELCKFIDKPFHETYGWDEKHNSPGEDFYQIEIEAFFDDPRKKDGNVRVMVMIDDGNWSAFKPMCDDFIITPEGKFL